VFRGCDVAALAAALAGGRLTSSEASGKVMAFRTGEGGWLGIHLGMTGALAIAAPGVEPGRADHLVLAQAGRSLVFSDPRMFGRVHFSPAAVTPDWWAQLAPPILSSAFAVRAVADFLRRHPRAPIKAVLLRQERFPGIGNWMADEILWRAGIHPRRAAGTLVAAETARLHRETRWVCRRALATIGRNYADPPKTWLFPHRWADGGRCPRTGALLRRETVGGRTTCWSPGRQPARPASA
jgi:formamidopyrimidine-DNA glycosylase